MARTAASDHAALEKLKKWFAAECDRVRPIWNAEVAEAQHALSKEQGREVPKSDVASQFAENAALDLQRLEAEIASMLVRTSIIVAAATLIFAVLALRPTSSETAMAKAGVFMLLVALLMTSVAFIAAVKALTPPIRRALTKPYEKREHWTLLIHDDFTSWVINCYLGERRASVITAYKKAHAIAVPLLVVAATLVIPGIGLELIFH